MRIDSHAHLAPGMEPLNRLLETMNRLEIQQCVVVGGGLIPPHRLGQGLSADEARALKFDHLGLLTQCAYAKGRLLPFYFANPWMEPDDYRNSRGAFFGLKLGPVVHGAPLNSIGTLTYVEIAQEFNHPVYLHCLDRDGFRVSDLATLAKAFPRTTFILGHGGIGQVDFQAVDQIAPYGNIYYETSGAFVAPVRHACALLGHKRILFGSEFPLQSARAELAKIEDLNLSAENLAQVMGGNIQRLLGRSAC